MLRGSLASTPSLGDGHNNPRSTSPSMAKKAESLKNGHAVETPNMADVKTLPAGVMPVRLIGEGAANAVFQLRFPEGSPAASHFQGWLLRVAKHPIKGGPLEYYIKQQAFYLQKIKPVLGGYVTKQELVFLSDPNLVPQLNALLQKVNATREAKFQGSCVAASGLGLLVEDMRPPNPKDSIVFEFKPKWLLQSPSAPPEAIRCRQCAMELYNFIKDPRRSEMPPEEKHCPLTLGNDDAPPEAANPLRIAPELAPAQYPREIFAQIAQDELFGVLRAAQKQNDTTGPLYAGEDDESFALAMTLRDCTCFVTLSRHCQTRDCKCPLELKLRLGDFDWKNPSIKIDRWRTAEKNLIQSGCYTADWILCNQQYYHPPTRCMLEWSTKSRSARRQPGVIHVQDKATQIMKEPKSRTDHLLAHMQTDLSVLRQKLMPYSREDPRKTTCPYRTEPLVKPNGVKPRQ